MSAYEQILDVAEDLIQKVGFHSFSYADVAEKVGIKKASIHYHFPAKTDLGKAMMLRHRINFQIFLDKLDEDFPVCEERLVSYLNAIFASTYDANQKMCLGGMLAANVLTLDQGIQDEVRSFFQMNELWLKKLLIQGKKRGDFKFSGDPSELAKHVLTTIEGTLLFARLYKDRKWLNTATKQILKIVK